MLADDLTTEDLLAELGLTPGQHVEFDAFSQRCERTAWNRYNRPDQSSAEHLWRLLAYAAVVAIGAAAAVGWRAAPSGALLICLVDVLYVNRRRVSVRLDAAGLMLRWQSGRERRYPWTAVRCAASRWSNAVRVGRYYLATGEYGSGIAKLTAIAELLSEARRHGKVLKLDPPLADSAISIARQDRQRLLDARTLSRAEDGGTSLDDAL